MAKRPPIERLSPEELAELKLWRNGMTLNGRELWSPVIFPLESVVESGRVSANYMVSTFGRVVRITGGRGTRAGTLLRTPTSRDGYPTVNLTHGGVCKTWNVHQLVARTFHGPAPEDEFGKFEAHHKNAKRDDNRAANIEWVSSRDNASSWWHKRMTGRPMAYTRGKFKAAALALDSNLECWHVDLGDGFKVFQIVDGNKVKIASSTGASKAWRMAYENRLVKGRMERFKRRGK